MGIPITWQSHGQKVIVISATKAEYVSLSDVVTTLMFIVMVLQSMEIEVTLPIAVYVDSIGATFLGNNHTTSDCTKHMDICYHLVHEYVEDGMVKIKFIKLEENDAGLFMKILLRNLLRNMQRN